MTDSYHHGDLRAALIEAALQQLQEQGLEQLTLRKLADKVGVSRTGAYHHFANKNDLVCAVAALGFVQLEEMISRMAEGQSAEWEADVARFVREYVDFAMAQPELYELMFGRAIWKVGGATEELKTVAHGCFSIYSDWVEQAVSSQQPTLSKRHTLRIAQANWAAIHGLCRLSLDGVYMASTDLSGVADEVAASMVTAIRG